MVDFSKSFPAKGWRWLEIREVIKEGDCYNNGVKVRCLIGDKAIQEKTIMRRIGRRGKK